MSVASRRNSDIMVSKRVAELCQNSETVSSALAKDPTAIPGIVVKKLHEHHARLSRLSEDNRAGKQGKGGAAGSSSEDEVPAKVLSCGQWGPTVPSPLFLQAFEDALNCLDEDAMAGMVSPPLMGSHGTIPLTIISPLIDIVRHCANMIVRAEDEVFFITSVWTPSAAQRLLKNALIELSTRAGVRGKRVTVRIMLDKAAASNAFDPHRVVKPDEWTSKGVDLPGPDDIPNINLEVISMHRFVLGTLHAKFCVVDRKAAAVMSNNMEDNDNLEMMTHLQGPIVQSIYDTALITWEKGFTTPPSPPPSPPNPSHKVGTDAVHKEPVLPREAVLSIDTYHQTLAAEASYINSLYAGKPGETLLEATNRHLNATAKTPVKPSGPDIPEEHGMIPYILDDTAAAQPVPMAMVSRPAYGPVDRRSVRVPQNEAWLSLIRHAQRSIFIQTPDLNASPLLPALADALGRGVDVTYYVCFGYNDAGEMIPGQGGTNEQAAQALISSLPAVGPEQGRLHIYNYVGKDQDKPLHQSFKSRSCHVKLLIADGAVAIQGSANQDTQSWYHSQEINVMVDSADICARWREAIERNQNTAFFGRVAEDGVWRDEDGNPAPGYMGDPGQLTGLFWGLGGMLKKWRHS